jgi:para-aminobenzoate synthetase
LAALCRRSIPGCIVHIIKNDTIPFAQLEGILDQFSAIVIGPGPGSPDNDKDIGIVKDIWKLNDTHLLPVFGVCLGLQSLVLEFGGTLKRLDIVKHGQISTIIHEGFEIFKGVGLVEAVRYHSLHVSLNGDEPLEALAWADDREDNGRILMAVKHTSKPFWAVQYHPESVCTSGGGDEVLRNFWRLAKHWSTIRARQVQPWTIDAESLVGRPWPHIHVVPTRQTPSPTADNVVSTRMVDCPGLSVTALCEALGVEKEAADFVLLDSAAQPGRFSIIGCLMPSSPRIVYRIGERTLRIITSSGERLEDVGEDVWTWLAVFMRSRKVQRGGENGVPFWGGFIGYLSYELGVHSLCPSLHSRLAEQPREHPDISLVFVERSVVLDMATGMAHVQSLLRNDEQWMENTTALIQRVASVPLSTNSHISSVQKSKFMRPSPSVSLPNKDIYIERICQAQDFLASGDSYELCLTAPTRVSVPTSPGATNRKKSDSWALYKTLRRRNPAPHSAYLRLHPSTLVASSPERFLSFSRPPAGICQLRPIKGTVRKAPGITRAVAEQALAGSTKEVAENLMIVDLIRHDLHSVVGDDVSVPQFCGVEEYETVWQLVSVIEGRLPVGTELDDGWDLGWEVLRQSLPPGR